jgi:hypothetical protein
MQFGDGCLADMPLVHAAGLGLNNCFTDPRLRGPYGVRKVYRRTRGFAFQCPRDSCEAFGRTGCRKQGTALWAFLWFFSVGSFLRRCRTKGTAHLNDFVQHVEPKGRSQ